MSGAIALALLAGLAPLGTTSAADHPTLSATQACSTLRKVIGKHDGFVARQAQRFWFCDPLPDDHGEWRIIGLRSYRQCDGICSNLRGWFAVHKVTGEVRDYDAAESVVGDESTSYRAD